MIHFAGSVARMFEIAGIVADSAKTGDVIALDGPLGAGKTHFAKGFASALGYVDPVTSPTFSLVQEYLSGRLPIYHIDFFRIETEPEAVAAGMEEYLPSEGVTLVEWASRFPKLLPRQTKWISIRVVSETEREITIEDAGH